jgi:hypothetical protein
MLWFGPAQAEIVSAVSADAVVAASVIASAVALLVNVDIRSSHETYKVLPWNIWFGNELIELTANLDQK